MPLVPPAYFAAGVPEAGAGGAGVLAAEPEAAGLLVFAFFFTVGLA
jgi:hypothetical protein